MVVVFKAILLFMKELNGRLLPLLGDVTRSSHINKQFGHFPDELGVVEF